MAIARVKWRLDDLDKAMEEVHVKEHGLSIRNVYTIFPEVPSINADTFIEGRHF